MVAAQKTHWLQNFDPSFGSGPIASSRSATLTATTNRPGGHTGIAVGLTNYTKEWDGFVFPDAGIPVWSSWHGTSSVTGYSGFTIEDMAFLPFGTGIYVQATQYAMFRRCQFSGIRMRDRARIRVLHDRG